ncbi:hypothetical protein H671_5g14923 [Cricetulus griseus]|uniref:Uncharacterized protein n=1 Tax=Cricetulus griseus TaxID=10029 RepID=A0A061HYT2_CRIGR|nr:hypothetical protein H671_5g14923 [Cricetulus griseus]
MGLPDEENSGKRKVERCSYWPDAWKQDENALLRKGHFQTEDFIGIYDSRAMKAHHHNDRKVCQKFDYFLASTPQGDFVSMCSRPFSCDVNYLV